MLRLGSAVQTAINGVMANIYLDIFSSVSTFVSTIDITARSCSYGQVYGCVTLPGVAWDYNNGGLRHGQLSRSPGGHFLTFMAYQAPVGTPVASVYNSTYPRVAVLVSMVGAMSSTTPAISSPAGNFETNSTPTCRLLVGRALTGSASSIVVPSAN